jgi:hypothetical protein
MSVSDPTNNLAEIHTPPARHVQSTALKVKLLKVERRGEGAACDALGRKTLAQALPLTPLLGAKFCK